jgi:hypothetical protein
MSSIARPSTPIMEGNGLYPLKFCDSYGNNMERSLSVEYKAALAVRKCEILEKNGFTKAEPVHVPKNLAKEYDKSKDKNKADLASRAYVEIDPRNPSNLEEIFPQKFYIATDTSQHGDVASQSLTENLVGWPANPAFSALRCSWTRMSTPLRGSKKRAFRLSRRRFRSASKEADRKRRRLSRKARFFEPLRCVDIRVHEHRSAENAGFAGQPTRFSVSL